MAPFDALRHALLVILATHHYPALFLLLLVEEAGVPLPLPGHALVMYEGVLSRTGRGNAALVLPLVWLAVTLGSLALYWLSGRYGQAAVHRYGRYIRLHPDRVEHMARHYRRWGPWAIIAGRLVPGVRVPTCIMAGIFAVPVRVYAPCTALAAAIWTLGYFYAGLVLERPVRRALAFYQRNIDAAVATLVLIALLSLVLTLLLRRYRQAHPAKAALEMQGR